jgi:hypothetical protein
MAMALEIMPHGRLQERVADEEGYFTGDVEMYLGGLRRAAGRPAKSRYFGTALCADAS